MEKDFVLLERDADFWPPIVERIHSNVDMFNKGIAYFKSKWTVKVRIGTRQSISPQISSGQNRAVLLDIPGAFLWWLDDIARFIHLDFPMREAVSLCRSRPGEDHSRFLHQMWLLWVVYHEMSHLFCGHLRYLSATKFNEFRGVSGETENLGSNNLRLAMEIDADIMASNMFFEEIGRLYTRGVWNEFYGVADAGPFVMQDLAIIFLPLFMQMRGAEPESCQSHPTAIHRLIIFQLFGYRGYSKEVGSQGQAHFGSYMAGLKEAIKLLIHLDGTMLHEEVGEIDFGVHRGLLSSVGMHKMRVIKIEDDWLTR